MASPHDHAKWLKKVQAHQKRRQERKAADEENTPLANNSNSSSSLSSGSRKKLVLNNNLKAVLCTSCAMSKDQVKDMVDAYNQ
eukprot:15117635-Ditylum_brightwellii.AAC.2